ncbi:MAG: hypothetical protein US50_C0034G0006 [Candidatus Nomurabacteria bacterium GW2011_GWB1_37_5]|uniref:Uncharacterized protein n=1 Tax=Candidatus Nomurabacteria bacterium GW2011_GWB1_37_5 TaxID=1618742 RepID=A0A0G0H8L0_9BACT|nr:MAG: hypothetical protein US50_C0034G0006 [Candidatus Nomurabacteria bacterium GW2011_GWB1_37_5]
MEIGNKEQILERRKKINNELLEMLKEIAINEGVLGRIWRPVQNNHFKFKMKTNHVSQLRNMVLIYL